LTISNTGIKESRITVACEPIYTALFALAEVVSSHATKPSSGNHWAVESEIFWKARGDHGWCAEAEIACVFKKLSEATARWYDAGERVA
jgi:short subunit fatty acids transporter